VRHFPSNLKGNEKDDNGNEAIVGGRRVSLFKV
jgi:hypothetical protein